MHFINHQRQAPELELVDIDKKMSEIRNKLTKERRVSLEQKRSSDRTGLRELKPE